MVFDGEGNLWVLTDAGIQICDQNGRVRAILSLPPEFTDAGHSRLAISDGHIILTFDSRVYIRPFNVSPATPGVRPPSQGAG